MITISQLEQQLDQKILNPSFADLKQIQDWFAKLEIADLQNHIKFEDDKYCRVPLISKKEYDILLCCWKPGQESDFHGHPDQGCLVKILRGATTEEVRFSDGTLKINENKAGGVGYINDGIGIHRVWNAGTENAVSLHLYAPGGYSPNS